MAKKTSKYVWEPPVKTKPTDVHRPSNKHKRSNYKKYRGQGR